MAKDPAMLWYWGDWNSGTTLLSRFIKGCYMDLLHAQFNNGPLSLEDVKAVLGGDFGQSWPTLQKKFSVSPEGLFFNERLESEKNKRKSYTESRRAARLKSDEDSVRIYLVKDLDTGFVKIGSSVNPLRRFAELCNQEKPAITVGTRNYMLYWVSEIIARSEEKVLHERFSNKRVKGEWFSLSEDDLNGITKTYVGTYEKRMIDRTMQRTENENENRNKEYLIPSLLKIWQAKNPNYPKDDHRDFEPLRKIAEFIAGQNNLSIENQNHYPAISEKFEKVCGIVASDKFWNGKPLISIEGRIQEFYSKANQSTTLKRFSGIV